ncbi:hypothetical protein GT204_04620 [Streptomyces sp. SID4919]|uniref:hypothetical protein n=1 Tax=unclassified Streptomyces TaxID=2593676 RepID=UPI000823A803|nr:MULTISPECIES: hypothetical protein [unclassified Streptomyces]MYY08207.1 hypothetical protein [Streptomyces sp. SID4919]SCK10057.1 hypothetical protein YW7DRAFT_00519 [Streptomyces sp. AmelKG-E11A]
MSLLAAPPTAEAVRVGDWDFGDFPYGLEPLVMPPAGHARTAFDRRPQLPGRAPEEICRELLALTGSGPVAARLEVPTAPSYDQLFWFRWITGHQVTFALWRMLGRVLDEGGDRDVVPGSAAMARLEAYTHGYCAMLLYSGSCPRGLYGTLIRSAMFLQHRGFSGTWAPDFAQVRGLMRGRSVPWLDDDRAAGLRAAVEAHQDVHDTVAARLVPGGRSLLQHAMAESPVRPSERTAVLYDNFFMTLRGQVTDEAVAAQLLSRLRAVALDLAVNGLYPLGRTDDGEEPEVWNGSVAGCERRLGSVLAVAGLHAAEVAAGNGTTTAAPADG